MFGEVNLYPRIRGVRVKRLLRKRHAEKCCYIRRITRSKLKRDYQTRIIHTFIPQFHFLRNAYRQIHLKG